MSTHQFTLPAAAFGGDRFADSAASRLVGTFTRWDGTPALITDAQVAADRASMLVTVEVDSVVTVLASAENVVQLRARQ